MARVITIEGHENLGEMLQPERPATKESPDYCLVVASWTRGWKPEWSLDEAYFNKGTAQAPQFSGVSGSPLDSLVMTGGVDYDHTVALFRNCGNGYWSRCYEGTHSDLGHIWTAAKDFWEYDRQSLHDGKSPLEFHEAQRAAVEYIPSYCHGCVKLLFERIEMSKMDYGQVFESFKVVASDHCDSCTEDESFAE